MRGLPTDRRDAALPAGVKTCACGAVHDAARWAALEMVGRHHDDEFPVFPDLELRNCICGSTLAIKVWQR